jgi:pimeloyl-ACP methyl ester carboxylesterase
MRETKEYCSRWVRVRGVKTHYVEAGDGEAVVLVHGGGPGASGEHGWRNTIPELAKHYRVLAIDMIGFGLTDKPLVEYSFEVLKDHLAGFIETLCLEPVRLMGNSVGAYVIVKCALDYPDRVKKVLMVSTANVARAMGVAVPETIATAEGMKALVAALENPTKETMRAFLERIVHQADHISDELIESRLRYAVLPGAKEAGTSLIRYMRARLKDDPNHQQIYDLRSRLPRLAIPLCLVWGGADRFAPVELGNKLSELLRAMEYHVLKNSGHQCQNDEIELFNEIAIRFFKG